MKKEMRYLAVLLVFLISGCSVTVIQYGRVAGYVYIREGSQFQATVMEADAEAEVLFSIEALAPYGYEALRGAEVRIAGRKENTDGGGFFSFNSVPEGYQTITVTHPSLKLPIKESFWVRRNETTWLDHDDALKGGVGYYIVIGINKYPGLGEYNIPGPLVDAQAVYNVLYLDNRLASVGKLLKNEGATKSEIEYAIRSAVNDAKGSDDYLVIYFSGLSGQDYLSPADDNGKDWDKVITDTELEGWVRGFPGHVTLIVDGADSASMADGQKFQPLALRQNRYTVISAAKVGQEVSYHASLGHSVFTYFLLEGIEDRVADRNRDGNITSSELYQYIKGEMKDFYYNSPQYRHEPQFHGGSYGDTVLFRY